MGRPKGICSPPVSTSSHCSSVDPRATRCRTGISDTVRSRRRCSTWCESSAGRSTNLLNLVTAARFPWRADVFVVGIGVEEEYF
jgi:hypothetical protein